MSTFQSEDEKRIAGVENRVKNMHEAIGGVLRDAESVSFAVKEQMRVLEAEIEALRRGVSEQQYRNWRGDRRQRMIQDMLPHLATTMEPAEAVQKAIAVTDAYMDIEDC